MILGLFAVALAKQSPELIQFGGILPALGQEADLFLELLGADLLC